MFGLCAKLVEGFAPFDLKWSCLCITMGAINDVEGDEQQRTSHSGVGIDANLVAEGLEVIVFRGTR